MCSSLMGVLDPFEREHFHNATAAIVEAGEELLRRSA